MKPKQVLPFLPAIVLLLAFIVYLYANELREAITPGSNKIPILANEKGDDAQDLAPLTTTSDEQDLEHLPPRPKTEEEKHFEAENTRLLNEAKNLQIQELRSLYMDKTEKSSVDALESKFEEANSPQARQNYFAFLQKQLPDKSNDAFWNGKTTITVQGQSIEVQVLLHYYISKLVRQDPDGSLPSEEYCWSADLTLNHKNSMNLHSCNGFHSSNGKFFIVAEIVKGHPLEEQLKYMAIETPADKTTSLSLQYYPLKEEKWQNANMQWAASSEAEFNKLHQSLQASSL